MQIKKPQADQKSCETQHLVTNLQYKVKPHGKKTKFFRARIDTCSNTNMMPASIYKILYNDPECTKLPPSKKNCINTYTKQKIPVIGSCELFFPTPRWPVFPQSEIPSSQCRRKCHNLMYHKHQLKSYTDSQPTGHWNNRLCQIGVQQCLYSMQESLQSTTECKGTNVFRQEISGNP